MARSAALRASGPDTLNVTSNASPDSTATRPGEVRKPNTLQYAAGLRSEPPESVPSATGSMRSASDAQAPPLLPPGVLLRSYGFSVVPNTALYVCEPRPNSGVLVL